MSPVPEPDMGVLATIKEGVTWTLGVLLGLVGLKKYGDHLMKQRISNEIRDQVKPSVIMEKLDAIHDDVASLKRSHAGLDTKVDNLALQVAYMKGQQEGSHSAGKGVGDCPIVGTSTSEAIAAFPFGPSRIKAKE